MGSLLQWNLLLYLVLWMDLLTRLDSITSYIGHLESVGWLSYTHLPNVNTFHHTIPKIRVFFNITIPTFQKSLWALGSSQTHSEHDRFSEILIFTRKLEFYHRQQLLSVVFFEVSGILYFWESVCHIPKSV